MRQCVAQRTHSSTLSVAVVLTLFLLGLLAACTTAYTVSEVESQAVIVPATPNVTLSNFNGPVEIVAGEEGRVRAELNRRSSNPDATAARTEVDGIRMAISQSGPDVAITITYSGPQNETTGAEAAVLLAVPPGSTVWAETGVGDISFDEQIAAATGMVGTGSVTFTVLEGESFTIRAEAESGELLSDVEALSSRPLFGVYEGGVGEEAERLFSAVLGQGRVYLRLIE